ncbi:hypothetical protein ACOMHN_059787 [Nucella lapillus]
MSSYCDLVMMKGLLKTGKETAKLEMNSPFHLQPRATFLAEFDHLVSLLYSSKLSVGVQLEFEKGESGVWV